MYQVQAWKHLSGVTSGHTSAGPSSCRLSLLLAFLFELKGSNLHFGAAQSSPAGLVLAGVIFFIVASMRLCFRFALKKGC